MSEGSTRGGWRPALSGAVLRAQTDERLCALAAAGHQQAFSVIFERYRRELRSHAARVVRADQVDDVVQQSMLGAWTALRSRPPIADLRAWLHRVVHNAALDTIARRGYDDGELPHSAPAPALTDELAEGRASAGAALAAMAALPESQRRALTLTAIEGRSGHDAALAMGISEGAMRQLIFRARSGVRAAVSALTPLPLINWLVGSGGASVAPAVLGAGGGAATAAKVIAVLGVTATLGVTNPLQSHHGPGRALHTPAGRTAATAPGGLGDANAAAQQVALVTPANPEGAPTRARLPRDRQPGRLLGSASQQPAGGAGGTGNRPGSPGATGGAGDQGSAVPAPAAAGDAGSDAQQPAPASDPGSAVQQPAALGDPGRGAGQDVSESGQATPSASAPDGARSPPSGAQAPAGLGADPSPPPPSTQAGEAN